MKMFFFRLKDEGISTRTAKNLDFEISEELILSASFLFQAHPNVRPMMYANSLVNFLC